MSSTVFKLTRTSGESMEALAKALNAKIGDELAFRGIQRAGGAETLLLVFEKFYFRTSSMAVLTIQCVSDGYEQKATVIGTGGGSGILNISWGANEDYAATASEILESLGFIPCK